MLQGDFVKAVTILTSFPIFMFQKIAEYPGQNVVAMETPGPVSVDQFASLRKD